MEVLPQVVDPGTAGTVSPRTTGIVSASTCLWPLLLGYQADNQQRPRLMGLILLPLRPVLLPRPLGTVMYPLRLPLLPPKTGLSPLPPILPGPSRRQLPKTGVSRHPLPCQAMPSTQVKIPLLPGQRPVPVRLRLYLPEVAAAEEVVVVEGAPETGTLRTMSSTRITGSTRCPPLLS